MPFLLLRRAGQSLEKKELSSLSVCLDFLGGFDCLKVPGTSCVGPMISLAGDPIMLFKLDVQASEEKDHHINRR